jgi:hypothetical protein
MLHEHELKKLKEINFPPTMTNELKILKWFADLNLANDPVYLDPGTQTGPKFEDVDDKTKEEHLKTLKYGRFMSGWWKEGEPLLPSFNKYILKYPLPHPSPQPLQKDYNILRTRIGGSRKLRKSICKNYNKKCKHNTKKHKIIHKKTKRQKYQKRK